MTWILIYNSLFYVWLQPGPKQVQFFVYRIIFCNLRSWAGKNLLRLSVFSHLMDSNSFSWVMLIFPESVFVSFCQVYQNPFWIASFDAIYTQLNITNLHASFNLIHCDREWFLGSSIRRRAGRVDWMDGQLGWWGELKYLFEKPTLGPSLFKRGESKGWVKSKCTSSNLFIQIIE